MTVLNPKYPRLSSGDTNILQTGFQMVKRLEIIFQMIGESTAECHQHKSGIYSSIFFDDLTKGCCVEGKQKRT